MRKSGISKRAIAVLLAMSVGFTLPSVDLSLAFAGMEEGAPVSPADLQVESVPSLPPQLPPFLLSWRRQTLGALGGALSRLSSWQDAVRSPAQKFQSIRSVARINALRTLPPTIPPAPRLVPQDRLAGKDTSPSGISAGPQLRRAGHEAQEAASGRNSLESASDANSVAFAGSLEHSATFVNVPAAARTPHRTPDLTKREIDALKTRLRANLGRHQDVKPGGPNSPPPNGNGPPKPPQDTSSGGGGSGGALPRWLLAASLGALLLWSFLLSPSRHNPVVTVVSFFGYYIVGNPIGFFFPFPQIATTYKARDASKVPWSSLIIPGLGALALTLTAYYMEAPMRFLAAQNLFELFTFSALLVMKLYYRTKSRKTISILDGQREAPLRHWAIRAAARYNSFVEKIEDKITARSALMKLAYGALLLIFDLAHIVRLQYLRGEREHSLRKAEASANTALEKLVSVPLAYRLTPETAEVWLKTIPTMLVIVGLTGLSTYVGLPLATHLTQSWVRARAFWLVISAAIAFGGFSLVSATEVEINKSSANFSAWPSWLFGSASIGLGVFSAQEIALRAATGTSFAFPLIYLLLNIAGLATAVLNLKAIDKYDPQGPDPRFKAKFFSNLRWAVASIALPAFLIFHSSSAMELISRLLFSPLHDNFVLHASGLGMSALQAGGTGAVTWLIGALGWFMGSALTPVPRRILSILEMTRKRFVEFFEERTIQRLGLDRREPDFNERLDAYRKAFDVHTIWRSEQDLQKAVQKLEQIILNPDHVTVVMLPWDLKNGQAQTVTVTSHLVDQVKSGKWLIGTGPGLDLDHLAGLAESESSPPGTNRFGEAASSSNVLYLIPVKDPSKTNSFPLKLSLKRGVGDRNIAAAYA